MNTLTETHVETLTIKGRELEVFYRLEDDIDWNDNPVQTVTIDCVKFEGVEITNDITNSEQDEIESILAEVE